MKRIGTVAGYVMKLRFFIDNISFLYWNSMIARTQKLYTATDYKTWKQTAISSEIFLMSGNKG